jgi:hypothetical protein
VLAPPLHTPAEHVEPAPQDLPQTPQLFELVFTSTHVSLQLLRPIGQHLLSSHTLVPAHTTPQPPQLFGSDDVSLHAFAQQVSPARHPEQPEHVPLTHVVPAPQV